MKLAVFLEKVIKGENKFKNFCLLIQSSGEDMVEFIMYDPSKVIMNDKTKQKDLTDSLIAVIEISRDTEVPDSAYQVHRPAAIPGLGAGAFMYDTAMSWASKKNMGLVPDRNPVKPSPSAQKIWQYYFQHRTDVKKIPIDDIRHPMTKQKTDDGELLEKNTTLLSRSFLDFIYMIKTPVKYEKLQKNHDSFMKTLREQGADVQKFKSMMNKAGNSFFTTMYKKRNK